MAKSKLELPEDHLASVGQDGGRVPLYPAIEAGYWRHRRTVVQIILIFIFLFTPWIKINGHPVILIDILGGQFSFFGMTFWAHDSPILFFIFATVLLTLIVATVLFGRVWCGWACPQTVFIEGVFRRVEQWVEGNHYQRKKLDAQPVSVQKLFKKSVKWILYLGLSLVIAHSFLAYFFGVDKLLEMVQGDPRDNLLSFIFMSVVALALFFDFSIFREQFCILICPYGRWQSVLLDKLSLTVAYDYNRGEPRRGTLEDGKEAGDCINCYKCVAVCPTGVDIRRGSQLECIACTACIDACDSIMEKINKPKGLIRYSSEAELEGQKVESRSRIRLTIYSALLVVAISGLTYRLITRSGLDVAVIRAKDVPYKKLEGPSDLYVNHYKVHIKNQRLKENRVRVSLAKAQGSVELVFPVNPLKLKSGEVVRHHFFIKSPKSLTLGSGRQYVDIVFSELGEGGSTVVKRISILGPKE